MTEHKPLSWREKLLAKDRETSFRVFTYNRKNPIPSRQVARVLAFKRCFQEITKQFGGEPRKFRRRMARAKAKRLRQGAIQ